MTAMSHCRQIDTGNSVFLVFRDFVENGVPLFALVQLGIDLDIEIALSLEIRHQRLLALSDGLIVDAHSLINGKQRFASPRPQMCAINLDLGDGARLDVEMNVGPVRRRLIFGSRELHLCSQIALFGERALEILQRPW